MRKWIVLIVIVAAGFFLYKVERVKGAVDPVLIQVFNYTPHPVKRLVFPVGVPAEFQGTYMADVPATAAWARQQGYANQPQPTGRKQIDIGGNQMVSQVHAASKTENVEVSKRGEGFIVVNYVDEDRQSLIEQDGNGVWIYYDEIAPGYRERYRKVR